MPDPADPDLVLPLEPRSLWIDDAAREPFGTLTSSVDTDVCVVGGGITGLTAALALAERGRRVIVLEAGRVGGGVTGHTTGKVTALHGLVYDQLRRRFGAEAAGVYARAQTDALAHVRERVAQLGIDCQLRTRTAYTYVTQPASVGLIEREVEAAGEAGLPAQLVTHTPLPYAVSAAIALPDQAEFDAHRYALGLARAIEACGGAVLQGARATGLAERPTPAVRVGDLEVRARDVIVATHMPFLDRGAFFVRLTPRRSYAIAVQSPGPAPDGMFISAGREPTRSIRAATDVDGRELLVIGGEGHNAGEHGDRTPEHYRRLAAFAREQFGAEVVTHRWSSQDLDPADGLPYVGRLTPVSAHVHVAAGFNKWGLTNGTAAALTLADAITGTVGPFGDLTDAWRVTPRQSAVGVAREMLKDGRHFVGDRLRRAQPKAPDALTPGTGALLRLNGRDVAAARDRDGVLHLRSPTCTHLGCRVRWNVAETSWDCPCHGSRFAP